MRILLSIGLGSGIGGMLRYLVGCWVHRLAPGFPWQTLAVNWAGCLFLGLLAGAAEGSLLADRPAWRMGLTVGLCGGFTTFSTFAQENLLMLREGAWLASACYMALSVLGGLLLALAGYALGRSC